MSEDIVKKILVVDDEEEVVEFLSTVLSRANPNYKTLACTRGKEAVTLAKIHIPDLIILDIVMPDMEGGEVASILSEDPTTSHIPIIFLTGILTKEEEASRTKSGKHFMLAKPTTAEEVTAKVHELLSN
ncbi:MAG: response regulator [Candidatus Omnitrophica bacterium]|nr:response regulator [Candidatus Omnitrophota bacterium]